MELQITVVKPCGKEITCKLPADGRLTAIAVESTDYFDLRILNCDGLLCGRFYLVSDFYVSPINKAP